MSSWVSIDKGSRTDFRSDRLNATTGTKPFGKSKCHYTGGIYFDKIQMKNARGPVRDCLLISAQLFCYNTSRSGEYLLGETL